MPLAAVKAHEVLPNWGLLLGQRTARGRPAARGAGPGTVRARTRGRSAAGWPAHGDGGEAGDRHGDQHTAGPAVGPVHRVSDGVLLVEDGTGDDQPDAQQSGAKLQAGEAAWADQGEG